MSITSHHYRRRPAVSILSLLLALLFLSASLTPSLIPRSPQMQGLLGGVVMALGYLIGQAILVLWHLADMPRLTGRPQKVFYALLGLAVVALLVAALSYALSWQNDLRLRMGMEAMEQGHFVMTLLVAGMVFLTLCVLGFGIQFVFDLLRFRLYRVMPPRRANVVGFLLVVILAFIVTRDGIVERAFQIADDSYEAAQKLFEEAPPMPQDPRFSGSAASLVDWGAMGQPGRDFVTGGPDAASIAAFTGREALDPIRVYVGRAEAETAQERAQIALEELKRVGGFSREVLVIASPTGTGWLDPGSHDPLEYMHGGDIATVAVQYSYLQSPMALVFETQTGLEQARETIHLIHSYWRSLPVDTRPRLYIHGLSLGAWSSMYATDILTLVDQPISGALWAGPPFPSTFWNLVQRMREPDSPWVQPIIAGSEVIRYYSHQGWAVEDAEWGDIRIVFLQYASDPIVFYEPGSVWRAPVWMREATAPDVTPALWFMPVVTHFQLVVDMMLSTNVPGGYGHSYYAQDYIEPWVEVTAPAGWTKEDTARLKQHCDLGFQHGCKNNLR